MSAATTHWNHDREGGGVQMLLFHMFNGELVWLFFPCVLQVSQFEKQISSATLVCLDGNIPISTIDYVCHLAKKHNINGKKGETVTNKTSF